MAVHVELRLFATLSRYLPPGAEHFPIERGTTIRELLARLHISEDQARLIFVDGIKKNPETLLAGGEKVGIFPPVGGG
jgi:molybdopterin converting factor small subunit